MQAQSSATGNQAAQLKLLETTEQYIAELNLLSIGLYSNLTDLQSLFGFTINQDHENDLSYTPRRCALTLSEEITTVCERAVEKINYCVKDYLLYVHPIEEEEFAKIGYKWIGKIVGLFEELKSMMKNTPMKYDNGDGTISQLSPLLALLETEDKREQDEMVGVESSISRMEVRSTMDFSDWVKVLNHL